MAGVSQYIENYPKLEPALPGQNLPWLQTLRKEALQQFAASGFPSPREEEWRYTNVSAIEKKLFTPVLEKKQQFLDNSQLALLESHQLQESWSIVFVNGRFAPDYSVLDKLPEGVIVKSLADVLNAPEQHEAHLKNCLSQAVSYHEHNLVAFNTAWFSDGAFIYIPAKQVLDKPVQLLNVVTQPDISAVMRNVVVIDSSAEIDLIETYAGMEQAYLTANVTEVFAGPNSCASYYKLQSESEKAYHFGGIYVKQADTARFTHHNFAFGSLLARTDIHADLEQAAECELNGLYLGGKRQHLDNHTRINHLKPYGISRELYKGVLDDRARGVFQGRVVVAENAQKTDSQMNNRNLLLSDDAEADTKPQLEIYADDVKCGHGVTVGQLDEKSVFYLQSRSVDEETARNMLTFAFANEMVNKVKIKSLHDQILGQVLKRFPQEGVSQEWL